MVVAPKRIGLTERAMPHLRGIYHTAAGTELRREIKADASRFLQELVYAKMVAAGPNGTGAVGSSPLGVTMPAVSQINELKTEIESFLKMPNPKKPSPIAKHLTNLGLGVAQVIGSTATISFGLPTAYSFFGGLGTSNATAILAIGALSLLPGLLVAYGRMSKSAGINQEIKSREAASQKIANRKPEELAEALRDLDKPLQRQILLTITDRTKLNEVITLLENPTPAPKPGTGHKPTPPKPVTGPQSIEVELSIGRSVTTTPERLAEIKAKTYQGLDGLREAYGDLAEAKTDPDTLIVVTNTIRNLSRANNLHLVASDGKEYFILPIDANIAADDKDHRGELIPAGSFLGGGGTAEVFKAFDPGLDRLVAIKVLTDNRFASRLKEEYKATSENPSPAIVGAYGEGLHPTLTGQNPFMAMEYITFGTLKDYRKKIGGRLEPQEAVEIGMQIAAAMSQMPVSHRDIKPENIFYDPATRKIKIADFGFVKVHDVPDDKSVTKIGQLFGTPGFSAPYNYHYSVGTDAQKRDKAFIESYLIKNDIFGIAATVYSLITGGAVTYQVGKALLRVTGQDPEKFKKSGFQAITLDDFYGDYARFVQAKAAGDTSAITELEDKYTPLQSYQESPTVSPRVLSDSLFLVLAKALSFDPERAFPDFLSFKQALESALYAQPAGERKSIAINQVTDDKTVMGKAPASQTPVSVGQSILQDPFPSSARQATPPPPPAPVAVTVPVTVKEALTIINQLNQEVSEKAAEGLRLSEERIDEINEQLIAIVDKYGDNQVVQRVMSPLALMMGDMSEGK